MSTDLHDLLTERIDTLVPPPGDLGAALEQGRRLRARRRTTTGVVAVVAVAALGVAAAAIGVRDLPSGVGEGTDATVGLGPLDLDDGLRAYGSPGEFMYLGGRKVPASDLDWLDTDAVAMSEGIVFYDDGRPTLIDRTGDFLPLVDGPVDKPTDEFHPTAKADGTDPVVAWATTTGGRVTITVRDLTARDDLGSVDLDCGSCEGLVIDGIDRGVVFVRDDSGTRTWDVATGEWSDFAGSETRVADVRNGVVLYDGPRPTAPGPWRLVKGAVDAQLTLDGEHVLSWSSTLEPTSPRGRPIELEAVEDATFFTIDTDGSVLAIGFARGGGYVVHDCELGSGRCEELPAFDTSSGDPVFIGNDM